VKNLSVILVMLASSGLAFAGDYTVDKVNEAGTRAMVKTKGEKLLYVGDVLEFKDEFAEVCRGAVVQVEPKSVVLDISDCRNAKAVKPGVEMTKGAPAPAGVAKAADVKAAKASGLNTPNEDWYFHMGFGFGSASYSDDELNDTLDSVENESGVDRRQVGGEMGFYWPLSDRKSMHGVASTPFVDGLDGPGGTYTLTQSLLAYSYYKFYGTNVGDGWFYRLDGGLARFTEELDTVTINAEGESDSGIGVLAGGGYAWPIGTDTRFLLSGYVSHLRAEGESATTTRINLSWLF
jgi:uncharacterized protein YkvS